MKRIEPGCLDAIFSALSGRGYTVVGPRLRDGAVVYDELGSAADLPVGWTDRQEAGSYRVERDGEHTYFGGYVVGPHSWKRFLFPPRVRLWQLRKDGDGFAATGDSAPAPRYAFVGVRSCELRALEIQDRVFVGRDPVDPIYASRRAEAFIIAVNCTRAGGTCFCVSMDTGPRVGSGFDLALTEVLGDGEHYFTVEVGSERGAEIMAEVPGRDARPVEEDAAEAAVAAAAETMGRTMDTSDLAALLRDNLEHPRWNAVAERCLSCANCTMVCPTCFCSTIEDVSDLAGDNAERWRRWDSCFSMEFSYLHGGSVRTSTRARYRQWMTHKLSSWFEQFGSSGCVGCGRCITWCPVGIDITEEAAAIRGDVGKSPAPSGDSG